MKFERIIAIISDFHNGKDFKKQNSSLIVHEDEKPPLIEQNLHHKIKISPNVSFNKNILNNSNQGSLQKKTGISSIFPEKESFIANFQTFALIIEGDVISHIFSSQKLIEDFLKVIPDCR